VVGSGRGTTEVTAGGSRAAGGRPRLSAGGGVAAAAVFGSSVI